MHDLRQVSFWVRGVAGCRHVRVPCNFDGQYWYVRRLDILWVSRNFALGQCVDCFEHFTDNGRIVDMVQVIDDFGKTIYRIFSDRWYEKGGINAA